MFSNPKSDNNIDKLHMTSNKNFIFQNAGGWPLQQPLL